MADRRERSITFRSPVRLGLGELKAGIEKEISESTKVFQDLGDNVYLLELAAKADAEFPVSNVFDVEEFHLDCSPPHGKFLNVSILGLRSYIHDDEVNFDLMEYEVLKSDVIHLKYKADHDLAGMENGNRLVKMVLDKPSLPYSMRIGGEWCRIIHNNQQPVCLECKELGHTRKKCPMIRCRVCKQLGHMSYICDQREEISQDVPSAERDGDAAVAQQDAQRGVPIEYEEDLEKDTRTDNNHANENQSVQEDHVEDMDHDERVQGLNDNTQLTLILTARLSPLVVRDFILRQTFLMQEERRNRLARLPIISCPQVSFLIFKTNNGPAVHNHPALFSHDNYFNC